MFPVGNSMAKKKKESVLVEVLRNAIISSGLTLNEIGRQSGVAVNQISRFVKGERTLTLPAAEKLCQALHLKVVKESPNEE